MSDDQTLTTPVTPPVAQPPAPPAVDWQQAPPDRSGGFSFSDFIAFRYLITPAFVTVIYVIGAVALVLVALGSMLTENFLAGLLILIFGQIYWRIILEFVIVLFKVNDSLKSIDRRGKGM